MHVGSFTWRRPRDNTAAWLNARHPTYQICVFVHTIRTQVIQRGIFPEALQPSLSPHPLDSTSVQDLNHACPSVAALKNPRRPPSQDGLAHCCTLTRTMDAPPCHAKLRPALHRAWRISHRRLAPVDSAPLGPSHSQHGRLVETAAGICLQYLWLSSPRGGCSRRLLRPRPRPPVWS